MTPERKLTDEQVEALAEHLEGTCHPLSHALDLLFGLDEDDMAIADCALLDDRVLCCETCGWWWEAGAMDADPKNGTDYICPDCSDDD